MRVTPANITRIRGFLTLVTLAFASVLAGECLEGS